MMGKILQRNYFLRNRTVNFDSLSLTSTTNLLSLLTFMIYRWQWDWRCIQNLVEGLRGRGQFREVSMAGIIKFRWILTWF